MPFSIGPGEIIIVVIIVVFFLLPLLLLARFVDRSPRAEPVSWGPGAPQAASPDPRVTLADRLARGEISREDFDTSMRALGYVDDPA